MGTRVNRITRGISSSTTLFVALLLVASVFLQIRWSPPNHKVQIDGTVFGYGGQSILRGEIPYKDFWDHKPPGVFYLDALAFWFLGADAWGIWYLTVFWTMLIALGFFIFLRVLTKPLYACFGTLILLCILLQKQYYQGSNMTEFYGVLPATIALYLAASYFNSPDKPRILGLGIVFTVSALLKPTDIGTPTICILVILVSETIRKGFRPALKSLSICAIPPLITAVVIVAYWGWKGAFADLWQATIVYNILYVQGHFGLRDVYATVRRIATDPSLVLLFLLALATTFSLAQTTFGHIKDRRLGQLFSRPISQSSFLTYAVCVGSLGMEILLISSTGRETGHYYPTAFPALCASASFWFRSDRSTPTAKTTLDTGGYGLPNLVLAGLSIWLLVIFGLVRPSVDDLRSFVLDAPVRRPLRTNVGKYISSNTSPSDTVLVWSTGAELNFETERKSPTPYVYYLPLFVPGFQNSDRWTEFVNDLEANPPALIIKPSSGYAPDFDVTPDNVASACHCQGAILEGFSNFSGFVREHYVGKSMFEDTFVVYHLKGSG